MLSVKKNKLAVALALIAGTLFLSNFLYKWLNSDRIDYTALLAGIFIIAFGIGTYTRKME